MSNRKPLTIDSSGQIGQLQSGDILVDGDGIAIGGGGGGSTVKVSANDTTSGYLNGKLVAGANITLTENNDGSNETLTIAAMSSNNIDGGYAGSTYLVSQVADGGGA